MRCWRAIAASHKSVVGEMTEKDRKALGERMRAKAKEVAAAKIGNARNAAAQYAEMCAIALFGQELN